jgi:hypothetical protein
MVIFGGALVVPLVLMSNAWHDGWRAFALPLLPIVAVVLLHVLTASSVRTTAGPNGVSVRFGLLGWPRGSYRIEQIERAEVVDLQSWSVAYGWWWTPRRTCYTVRSGPTLRLTLHTGRTITITVPDAQAALTVIREAKSA